MTDIDIDGEVIATARAISRPSSRNTMDVGLSCYTIGIQRQFFSLCRGVSVTRVFFFGDKIEAAHDLAQDTGPGPADSESGHDEERAT
jgi:hypothetical protein